MVRGATQSPTCATAPGSGSVGRRKPQSTSAAQTIVRRSPLKRSSHARPRRRAPRAAAPAARSRTPRCASRTFAGARSPVRLSSLPAIWSCVISTARSPSSSASATAIGPPIGSNSAIAPVGQGDRFAAHVDDVEHGRVVVDLVLAQPRPSARRLDEHLAGAVDVGVVDAELDRHTLERALARPASRRAAARAAGRRRDAAGRRATARRSARGARAARRRVRSPGRPRRRRRRRRRAGRAAGAYQSGSSVSRPDDGSPTHVTIGLRASRTWHVWLQRMHGRIRSGSPRRSLRDEQRVGDLRAGHLDARRTRRRRSPTPPGPQSTTEPWRNTGTSPARGSARLHRAADVDVEPRRLVEVGPGLLRRRRSRRARRRRSRGRARRAAAAIAGRLIRA